MKSIQWMCSSNKCVFLTILIAAVCASRQVATAQRHSGLKFEISFPEGVHSGPITGRVYAIISRNSDREPRFQTGFLGRTGGDLLIRWLQFGTFLSHARTATVLFENRTVPVSAGVIIDSFGGLERHVYVVDGIPPGVTQRPVARPGGPHVTDAGKTWRIDASGPIRGRSQVELQRERFMEREIEKAEQALRRGDRAEARRIYEGILECYPDAQNIRERLRSM